MAMASTNMITSRACRMLAASMLALIGSLPSLVFAQKIVTWDGGGTDEFWSTAENWSGTAPEEGDILMFDGTLKLANNNDVIDSVTGMVFAETATGFVINGNPLTVGSDGIRSGGGANQLNMGFNVSVDQSWGVDSPGGTLQVSGSVNLQNHTLTIDKTSGGRVVLSGQVQGSGGVFQVGQGMGTGTAVARLSGNNTHTGGTWVQPNGVLEIGSDTAVGNGVLTLNGGSIATVLAPRTINNNVVLTATSSIQGDLCLTFTGQITESGGSFGINKMGTGSLTLFGNNTFSGTTTIYGGLLGIGHNKALGNGSLVMNGGLIQGAGGPWTVGNPITLQQNTIILGSGNLTFSGPVNESGGSFGINKMGTGTLTLMDVGYTGATTLNEGVLALGSDNALGSGRLNWVSGTLTASGGTRNVNVPVTLSGTGTVDGMFGLEFNKPLTLGGNATLITQGNGATMINGIIDDGADSFSIQKMGPGSLVLGQANTFNGGVILAAGYLALGNDQALGPGKLQWTGGTLRAVGARTIGNEVDLIGTVGVSGSSPLVVSGPVNLKGFVTINVNNSAETTLSGTIANTRDDAFIKMGSGTLVLSGNNTHSGYTVVQQGALSAGHNNALGNSTVVLDGGTLNMLGDRTLSNPLDVYGSGTISGNNAVFNGSASFSGSATLAINNSRTVLNGPVSGYDATDQLTKTGPGMLVLSGNNSGFKGSIVVSGGLTGYHPSPGQYELNLQSGSTLPALITVGANTRLSGGGVFGGVHLLADSTFSPGSSIGAPAFTAPSVWDGGSRIDWEINQADGTAGVNWDCIALQSPNGSLQINNDALHPITISLMTLDSAQNAALMANWDPARSWSWLLASGGSISVADPSAFVFDTTDFANALAIGSKFQIASDSSHLWIQYAVPEPQDWCWVTALGLLGFGFWRKQQSLIHEGSK